MIGPLTTAAKRRLARVGTTRRRGSRASVPTSSCYRTQLTRAASTRPTSCTCPVSTRSCRATSRMRMRPRVPLDRSTGTPQTSLTHTASNSASSHELVLSHMRISPVTASRMQSLRSPARYPQAAIQSTFVYLTEGRLQVASGHWVTSPSTAVLCSSIEPLPSRGCTRHREVY